MGEWFLFELGFGFDSISNQTRMYEFLFGLKIFISIGVPNLNWIKTKLSLTQAPRESLKGLGLLQLGDI